MKKWLFFLVFMQFLAAIPFEHEVAGYLVDLPSGWSHSTEMAPAVIDFSSPDKLVNIHIYSFNGSQYPTLRGLEELFRGRLKFDGHKEYLKWGEYHCMLMSGSVTNNGEAFRLLMTIAHHAQKYSSVIMAIVQEKHYRDSEAVMLSFIDSFAPEKDYVYQEGLISRKFYRERGAQDKKPVKNKIAMDEEYFDVDFNEADRQVLQSLMDREVSILMSYKEADHEAMLRMYRLIYRYCYDRFDRFIISLKAYARDKKMTDEELFYFIYFSLHDMPTVDLNTTRIMKSPMDVLLFGTGDCDSKSLTMQIIMDHLKMDGSMLISYQYQHSAFAMPLKFFSVPKRVFMLGEKNRPLVFFEMLTEDPYGVPKKMNDPRLWHNFKVRYN